MTYKLILALGVSFILAGCSTTPKPDASKTGQTTEPTSASVESETEQISDSVDIWADDPIASKYERIEYGQALPLVCTPSRPATGIIKNRPNLQRMWENYLYDRPEGIWGEIGGKVEVNGTLPLDQGRWTNACTVRLSHMLNQADYKIPNDGSKTVSGGNGDQYYYRLRDFEDYMKDVFGAPDIAINDGSADSFSLPDRPGIVLMDFPGSTFNGHVTIWNGAGSVDNADIGGHRVLFWELPCFIPEDRDQTAGLIPMSIKSAVTP